MFKILLVHYLRSSLTILKEGEEKKTKCYRALCFLLNHEARDKCSDKLKELPVMFPLTLQQATPIRVSPYIFYMCKMGTYDYHVASVLSRFVIFIVLNSSLLKII